MDIALRMAPGVRRGTSPGLLASPLALVAALFALGLALRAWTFGDPNLFVDDDFYLLVGQQMHHGALPYVDIWDRKPLGLFLLYWLFASAGSGVLAYQIAAWLASSATGYLVCRIAVRIGAPARGAALAGLAYVAAICPLDGFTGQSAVFYNLIVAGAALLVLNDASNHAAGRAGIRTWAALALCGLALTIKQTTLFEGLFIGLYALHRQHRGGASPAGLLRTMLGFGLVAASPTLAIAGWYAAIGHWAEYWHAMVPANLDKASPGPVLAAKWAMATLVRIAVPLAFGLSGAVLAKGPARGFLSCWLVAALAGYLAVPNFYVHYSLPLVVPLCTAAAFVFGHDKWGRILFVALLAFINLWFNPTDRAWTLRSIASFEQMAEVVRAHDGGGGLFVYEGPPQLYTASGRVPLSPLVLPHHFNHLIERNTSHLDTHAELVRLLARGPGIVVLTKWPMNDPVNWDSQALVTAYVRARCRKVATIRSYQMGVVTPLEFHGDCRPLTRPGRVGADSRKR